MRVSIIIPTLNRCVSLGRTLDSLAHMDWRPDEFEVLVIDNGSTDQTRATFDSVQARFPAFQWKYYYEPVPGLLAGRHRGAVEASGDICAYLDDDVRLGRDWLTALKEAFGHAGVALVGGPSSPLFETDPPDWLAAYYRENAAGRACGALSLFDGGAHIKEIDPGYVWGLNFAIRKTILLDLGGFHPDLVPKSLQRFQGDGESGLGIKVRLAGLKALYHPGASVQHEVPASRLTVGYFEQRFYFQGVADSYTRIRAEHTATRAKRRWKYPLRRIKRLVLGRSRTDETPVTGVRLETGKAYAAGYAFHQDEVRHDPKLLEWVLRKDYWDYQFPP